MIFIVVLRWVEGFGLSFLSHLKLLTRLPDNHVSLKRQLTLNALQFSQTTIKVRAVAAIHEVIQGTNKLNTQRAGHGVSSPKPRHCRLLEPTPFLTEPDAT